METQFKNRFPNVTASYSINTGINIYQNSRRRITENSLLCRSSLTVQLVAPSQHYENKLRLLFFQSDRKFFQLRYELVSRLVFPS